MRLKLLIILATISIFFGISAGVYLAFSMGTPSSEEAIQTCFGHKIYADDDVYGSSRKKVFDRKYSATYDKRSYSGRRFKVLET
jgi:hypothetical protein